GLGGCRHDLWRALQGSRQRRRCCAREGSRRGSFCFASGDFGAASGGFFDDGMFPTGSPFAVAVAGVIRLASGAARLPADRRGEAKTEPSALAGEGHDPCRTALSFGLPNMSASAAITADWGQARTQCCSMAALDATTLATSKPVMLRGN